MTINKRIRISEWSTKFGLSSHPSLAKTLPKFYGVFIYSLKKQTRETIIQSKMNGWTTQLMKYQHLWQALDYNRTLQSISCYIKYVPRNFVEKIIICSASFMANQDTCLPLLDWRVVRCLSLTISFVDVAKKLNSLVMISLNLISKIGRRMHLAYYCIRNWGINQHDGFWWSLRANSHPHILACVVLLIKVAQRLDLCTS